MELNCALQTYDWGKRGGESIVAKLVKSANDDFVLEENKSYAELWMGTHPNGPSRLKKDGTYLRDYIKKNGKILGKGPDGHFFEDLPFLFKILSVGKALSIQAHPDKSRAERLHLEKPEIYKDPNHKPELAIALSPFEAFCGFRPTDEIKRYIEMLPEFRAVIGNKGLENALSTDNNLDQAVLAIVFQAILVQKPEIITNQLNRLIDRLSSLDESERLFLHANLLERLHKDYPGDVGCFGVYFFNYVTLEPGEAIYIAPNEPHAYLSGDCVECMACSDNVVRAGLTPKLKDVTTLIEMLTFNCEAASMKRFQGTHEDDFTEVFRPPVSDFAVAKISISSETVSYDLIPRNTASILLIVNGKAKIADSNFYNSGTVLLIPADEKINLQLSCHPILMFQAFANVSD